MIPEERFRRWLATGVPLLAAIGIFEALAFRLGGSQTEIKGLNSECNRSYFLDDVDW